ncbi:DMT family transporter [Pantoea sp. 1.19]|uniref:DMT family transporter n=1 Tax=Pantoea sp. 1.19 TaxID=1925589 RepID=UPI000948EE21|nr:DMT family transporter [Pantoea sp. 1.19]
MQVRQPLDARATGTMIALCLIWGVQQVAIKGVADQVSPLWQVAMRSGVAAVCVWLFMRWQREPMRLADGIWRAGLLVGVMFALEFLLLAEGLRLTSASHMAVFLYTAPIFAALGLQLALPEERLAALQWVGVALTFSGVAVAFLLKEGSAEAHLRAMLIGDALGLAAGFVWGATTVVVRCSVLATAPASHTLFYQLASGFVLLTLVAGLTGDRQFAPQASGWLSMAFQSLVVTFGSYLIWFTLLRRYLASRLGVLSFLTPVFGVMLGAWWLHEPLQPGFIGGALLILAGIVIVSGYGWLAQRRRR